MADVVAEEQPDTFLKEYEAIWKQQAAEKEALRKSITKAYQDLNKLEGTKHGYPIGVSRLVLEAVQMGIFYPGQALQEAIGTFGDAPEVTTDWLLVQRGGKSVLLIPLEYRRVESGFLPNSGGTQWHLALMLKHDSIVERISMEYCGAKSLTNDNVKYDLYRPNPQQVEKEKP